MSVERSHPSWVCGLKLAIDNGKGAGTRSHPSWVCGLKHAVTSCTGVCAVSHPSWVCGLKLLGGAATVLQLRHTLRGCVD